MNMYKNENSLPHFWDLNEIFIQSLHMWHINVHVTLKYFNEFFNSHFRNIYIRTFYKKYTHIQYVSFYVLNFKRHLLLFAILPSQTDFKIIYFFITWWIKRHQNGNCTFGRKCCCWCRRFYSLKIEYSKYMRWNTVKWAF